jgi:hypothetical protein
MLLAFLVSSSFSSAANARPQAVKVTMPMVQTGFDEAVANANGYQVKVIDGVARSVKVSNGPVKAAATPSGPVAHAEVVTGNCGASFLYYAAAGGRKADIYTGFDIWRAPAISYGWKVAATDKAGVGSRSWSGGLAFRWNWETHWMTYHSVSGYSFAQVVSGHALLADGTICTSGLPSDSTNLY